MSVLGIAAQNTPLDTAKIRAILAVQGAWNEQDSVYRVSIPKIDVKVTVDGMAMPSFLGMSSWVAFKALTEEHVMLMGDFALFQDEVNPVMSVALASGLEVTALHNHFFYDDPRVFFMHVHGEDSASKLAVAVRNLMQKVMDIRVLHVDLHTGFAGPAIPQKSSLDAASLEKVLGVHGESVSGMFRTAVGRKAKMSCGCEATRDMGLSSWIGFAGNKDSAIVDGDFAAQEFELRNVLVALRNADINVLAIHNHMIEETPRFVFVHFWGKGKVAALARGIRAALDATQNHD
jgi:hypothetical protein